MKKYLNYALAYAIAAMAGGVFYREFTKLQGYTGVTVLGKVHTHLFLLGMLVCLMVALFAERLDLTGIRTFSLFQWCYHIGVPLNGVMMLVRGITQVLGLSLSKGTMFRKQNRLRQITQIRNRSMSPVPFFIPENLYKTLIPAAPPLTPSLCRFLYDKGARG